MFKIAYKRCDFYSYWKVVFTALIFDFNIEIAIYKLWIFLNEDKNGNLLTSL